MVNRLGINHVVVVEDENEIVRDGGDFIERGRQNRFDWWRLRGLEPPQPPCSNIRRNPFVSAHLCPRPRCRQGKRLQSSDEGSQKACGIGIPFVQRKPGGRSLATGNPFTDQRGLPKTSRRRDEGKFASKTLVLAQTLVQPLDQAGAEDNLRPRWGDIKFSGQNWRRHTSIVKHIPQNSKAAQQFVNRIQVWHQRQVPTLRLATDANAG